MRNILSNDREIPVRIEAATALQQLLSEQEKGLSYWALFFILTIKLQQWSDLESTYLILLSSWHPGTLTLRAERQSAWMSKITNDDLTRSGTGCFITVCICQQWALGVNGFQNFFLTVSWQCVMLSWSSLECLPECKWSVVVDCERILLCAV